MTRSPSPARPGFFQPFRVLLAAWFFSFLGWGTISLAWGWQMGHSLFVPWPDVLRIAGRDWLVWTLLTPLIFRFVRQFPFERERWKLTLAAHLAVCLLVVASIGALGEFVLFPRKSPAPGAQSSGESRPRPNHGFLGWLLLGPHLPIYLAVLSASHALYFYRRGRERELRAVELSARLAEARLQALRMQIQPHFLFNSLNAIVTLVHKDANAAEGMLVGLSDFLRLTLDRSTEQEVPLRKELEYVERYLAIEKVRFGPRLTYLITPDADTLAAHLPTLLLQPLVENAIRHGIEQQLKDGVITIRAWQDGPSLHVTVTDNGPGFDAKSPAGIGLANTRARLLELYAGAANLSIKSVEGTEVEARIPLHFS